MSAVEGFGLVWAAAGIVLGLRWWQERGPEQARRAALELPANARFGQVREDGSRRRLQAMRLAYAAGTTLISIGLLTGLAAVLALGAAMVNLGTIYRYLVLALDLQGVDVPLVVRSPGPAAQAARPLAL